MERSSFAFSGVAAELRYGYHVVARLGRWTINADHFLDARLAGVVNPVWIRQSALTFVWHISSKALTRELVDVLVTDERVTARVLFKERT